MTEFDFDGSHRRDPGENDRYWTSYQPGGWSEGSRLCCWVRNLVSCSGGSNHGLEIVVAALKSDGHWEAVQPGVHAGTSAGPARRLREHKVRGSLVFSLAWQLLYLQVDSLLLSDLDSKTPTSHSALSVALSLLPFGYSITVSHRCGRDIVTEMAAYLRDESLLDKVTIMATIPTLGLWVDHASADTPVTLTTPLSCGQDWMSDKQTITTAWMFVSRAGVQVYSCKKSVESHGSHNVN
ncbi:hypothetical protein ANO11243_056540 [Dothideomycetidae sp. 11243]|nr:hypothetical protein ANO11243_056540 [fungal sp. No.11243]